MNTPHQGAVVDGAYRAEDADGRHCLIALFDGSASDGRHTHYEARDVSWCVWVRDGRIVAAHRYSGRNRDTARREFNSVPDLVPTVSDAPEYRGMTWKQWAPLAQRDTRQPGCISTGVHADQGELYGAQQ
jgi:hypothetical protein